jgi:hypothetical protein
MMKRYCVPVVLVILMCVVGCSDDDSGGSSPGPTVSATFTVTPTAGTVITDFAFDASASAASSGELLFRWDWEGDGTWDTDWASEATATRRFTSLTDGLVHMVDVVLQVKSGSTIEADTAEITIDTRHGQVLASFPLYMTQATAVTADETHLWVADWGAPGSGRIYKYQTNGDTLYSIPAPDIWPNGLAWDGIYLCATGHLNLYKLDPTNGDVLDLFPVIYSNGQWGGGLAWDGTVFYFSSIHHPAMVGDDLIHKYAADGTEMGTMEVPLPGKQPLGLAIDGLHLWSTVSGEETLYVRSAATGAVQRKVYVSGLEGEIAILNGYVWAIIDVGPGSLGQIVP